jgi:hypothetical protein
MLKFLHLPPLNLHSPLYKKLWQQQRRKRRLENSQEQQDLLTECLDNE